MELRQLAHFLAVADEGHVTRAARGLHLQQSSLSSSIRALERDLGASLFVRGPRGTELTQAGRALVPAARRAVAAAEDARDTVLGVRHLLRGRVVVGAIADVGDVDLAGHLARFHQDHPAVEIQLRQAAAPRLVEATASGEVDLAVVDTPTGSPGVVEHVLAVEHLVLAVPRGHPLADRTAVDLGDLAGLDVVDYRQDSALRASIDVACTHAGVRRRTVATVETLGHLVGLVGAGVGVALIPPRAVDGSGPDVVALAVRPVIPRELAVVTADRPSPAAAALRAGLASET